MVDAAAKVSLIHSLTVPVDAQSVLVAPSKAFVHGYAALYTVLAVQDAMVGDLPQAASVPDR